MIGDPGWKLANSIAYALRDPVLLTIAVAAVLMLAGLAVTLYSRERRRHLLTKEALTRLREQFSEVQALARIGMWEYDIETDAISWSDETFNIFGLRPGGGEPDFADVLLSIHPDDSPVLDRAIQRAIFEKEVYRLDLRIYTPEHALRHIHAQGTPVLDGAGQVRKIVGTILDISERMVYEQRLAQDATHDPLTGLANRRHFLSQLKHEIEIAQRNKTPLALCMSDLDHFKGVNDAYGHASGDRLLVDYASIISKEIRQSDLGARLGGDEFCIVFQLASADQARVSVERIRSSLEARVFTAVDGRHFRATATFGLADWTPGMGDAELMDAADRALYGAKRQGRNRSVVGN